MDEFIEEILKNINGKKILGTKDNLSKSFEALANQLDISKEEALNIQNQLIDEYEVGKVKDEGLFRRMIFLCNSELDMNNIHKISLFMNKKDACPYCGLDLDKTNTCCNICGYNLEYEGDEDEEIITEEEAKEFMTDILVNMGKLDKETADLLFNSENNVSYYEDGNIITNFDDSIDFLELNEDEDEDEDDDFMDEFGEICYRLDPSHNCTWDTHDICLYKSLEDLYHFPGNIEDIIKEQTEEYDYDDNEKIFDELVNNGYITKYLIPEYWENTAQNIKKKDLQDILRHNDLKISGNKNDLVKRIKENVNLEEIEFNSIDSFNYIDYTIYLTTPLGVEFLDSHKYISLFDYPLYEYHYEEYKKFIEDKDDYIQATIEFLELHVKIALKKEDSFEYLDHLKNQEYIYDKYNDEVNHFKSLVRLFIAYLNPIDTDDIFFYCDNLIEEDILNKIRKLNEENEYDIEAMIVDEYSRLDHITVPLKELIENLPILLSKNTHKQLDKKWRKKYLKHNLADW